MTGNDISWSAPGETFNLRVAAVIIDDRKALRCTVDGLGALVLAGGRARFGEPAELALPRELAEELGHQFPAGRLALVVENIYRDSSLQHEVGFYYRLAWPPGLADSDLDGGTRPSHRFRWAAISELNPCALSPLVWSRSFSSWVMTSGIYSWTGAARRKVAPTASPRT